MAGQKDKKVPGLTQEPMQAIGEALVRTFQSVADEEVPEHLLDLLDKLSAGESDPKFPAPAALKNGSGQSHRRN